MNIKDILLGGVLMASASAVAATASPEAANINLFRDGSRMNVEMDLDLSNMKPGGMEALLLTPMLVNGNDTLLMQPVGIYSKNRYMHYLRSGRMLSEDEITIRTNKLPSNLEYRQSVQYRDWMDGAELLIRQETFGCCRHSQGSDVSKPLAAYAEPKILEPELLYVLQVAEEFKQFKLSGSAFVDFPVNKTEIYPEYRNNPRELAKIRESIDSVKNDADITINSVNLMGFASPEGSYANNTRLAKGRVAAIEKYIQSFYKFPEGVIHTSYEPEDWAGLRAFLEGCNLDNKNGMLAIVDSNLSPDAKDAKLKKDFPTDYAFILKNVYPALRHTDYEIEYTVRKYTDINEILRIYAEAPNKLSLNEFYLAAQAMTPGSKEFYDVFETAARMYPMDEIANMNAANAALQRNDLANAEKYLDRAGSSGNALYAKGVLEYKKGNLAKAKEYWREAEKAGVAAAGKMLREVK